MPAHSELRVHGVSGSPPRAILYTDPVTPDPDDDYTRIYRRRKPDLTTTADGAVHEFEAEAFHWGGLTSGHWITAFWMLLSPFAFANVAGWMTTSDSRIAHLSVRLAGLGLTVLFVVQMGYVFLEIPSSLELSRWWLVVAAAAYVAFIVLFIVLRLSTQSHFNARLTRMDRLRLTFHPAIKFLAPPEMWKSGVIPREQWGDPAGADLSDRAPWQPHAITNRIRRIHLAASMLVIAVLFAAAVSSWWVRDIALWGGLALVLLLVLTSFLPKLTVTLMATAWAPVASLVVLGLAVWQLLQEDLPVGGWPEINVVTFAVALALGAAAATTLIAGLRTLGAIGLGTLLGGSLGIGAAMAVESAVGLDTITEQGAGWVAIAMLGLILALVLTAVVMAVIPIDGPLPRSGRVLAAFRRVTRRSHWIFIVAALYSLAAGLFAFANGCVLDSGAQCDPANLGVPESWGTLVAGATWLIILIPTGFILRSLATSLVTKSSNRHVGILWDLASFWPRWYHPLAPPAYGPKIVADLRDQLILEPPDLLEAHSQGSVIATATLAQMQDVSGLTMITYGSPMGILYRRLFPRTGVDELISSVDEHLHGRWRNLWRDTDPLGGEPIGIGDRDVKTATGTGHAAYEVTGEFKKARLDLLA